MNSVWLVFLGGGLGSVSRFWLAGWVMERLGMGFPYGTLAVNLLGCFIIGLIAGLPDGTLPQQARLLLMTGFLGGLTTFSTYEYESFLLVTHGETLKALLNLGGSLVLGLLAVGLGYFLMRVAAQGLKGA